MPLSDRYVEGTGGMGISAPLNLSVIKTTAFRTSELLRFRQLTVVSSFVTAARLTRGRRQITLQQNR